AARTPGVHARCQRPAEQTDRRRARHGRENRQGSSWPGDAEDDGGLAARSREDGSEARHRPCPKVLDLVYAQRPIDGPRRRNYLARMQPAGRPMVAVVDDDTLFRRSIERLLRSVGFRIEAFGSAEDFLEHGQLDLIACAILDMKLPGMSGLDL